MLLLPSTEYGLRIPQNRDEVDQRSRDPPEVITVTQFGYQQILQWVKAYVSRVRSHRIKP